MQLSYSAMAATPRQSNPAPIIATSTPSRANLPMPTTFAAGQEQSQELLQTSGNVAHHLSTKVSPNVSALQWLDPEKLEAAQKEFATCQATGVVRWSTSLWASPPQW